MNTNSVTEVWSEQFTEIKQWRRLAPSVYYQPRLLVEKAYQGASSPEKLLKDLVLALFLKALASEGVW